MPVEHVLGDVLRQLQILAHAVAIVVVRDVFAPIHQRRACFAGFLAVVIRIDLLLAAVHFDHRRDEDDHVVADGLDEGRLFDDQAVSQLDQHFGAAGFGRMDAAGGPVNRLAGFDQLLRLLFGGFSRIAERGEHGFVLVEIFDGGFIGDGKHDLVAALLRTARSSRTWRAATLVASAS